MANNKNYPDELTAKMHSEFTVSKETRIMLKAGCVCGRAFRPKPPRRRLKLGLSVMASPMPTL